MLIVAYEQKIRTISDIDTLYGQLVNRLNLVIKCVSQVSRGANIRNRYI